MKTKIKLITEIIACLLLCTIACTNNSDKSINNKLDSIKILIEKRNVDKYNMGILPCPYCGKQGILTHCICHENKKGIPNCWIVYCESTADTITGESCPYMDNDKWLETQNEAITNWNKWCLSK